MQVYQSVILNVVQIYQSVRLNVVQIYQSVRLNVVQIYQPVRLNVEQVRLGGSSSSRKTCSSLSTVTLLSLSTS